MHLTWQSFDLSHKIVTLTKPAKTRISLIFLQLFESINFQFCHGVPHFKHNDTRIEVFKVFYIQIKKHFDSQSKLKKLLSNQTRTSLGTSPFGFGIWLRFSIFLNLKKKTYLNNFLCFIDSFMKILNFLMILK